MQRVESKNLPGSSLPLSHQPVNPMRVNPSPNLSSRPNEDKCNIYFTNFLDAWESCHFWEIFKAYGDIIDVHIPVKRNSKGQRFGFICFLPIDDLNSLLLSLNQIWIGSFKLRFYIARGEKRSTELKKNFQPTSCSQSSFKNVVSQHYKSYAEVVKGANDCTKNSGVKDCPWIKINDGASSISKCPEVEFKSGSKEPKETKSSFTSNHVDISMDNGVLVIKINFQELLGVLSSDSEDSQSSTKKNKTTCEVPQNTEMPLDVCNQAVSINRKCPTSNNNVKPYRKRTKSYNLLFGPLSLISRSHITPFSPSMLLGGKQLQSAQVSPSMQRSSSHVCSEVPNSDLDRGKFCLESNEGNKLGSPCISIHTRSVDDFYLPCGGEYNSNEVSGKLDDHGAPQLIDNTDLEVDSKENELIVDDQSPNITANSVAEHIVADDNDLEYESEDELVCANLIKTKNFLKKKKRKNYKWSKKKIRPKVKVQDPSPPKLTVEDTCISDSFDIVEAIKTLEVAKLLGLSFFEDDELIINHMMVLEREEQASYKSI